MARERLLAEHPKAFFLDPENPPALVGFLAAGQRLLASEAVLSVAKAGEGNMNCVVRVTTDQRTFILKQARPWVEKYPQIAAPWDRALAEVRFFRAVEAAPLVAKWLPRILWVDEGSRILALEDLGAASDLSGIYRGEFFLSEDEVASLSGFLGHLHAVPIEASERDGFANRAMRVLNHEHIFRFPLDPANGLSLDGITPGLAAAAAGLQEDSGYSQAVTVLGGRYLTDGATLLHGDFFPGSILRTANGLRVIDPEFGFLGNAEFDVGVFYAHLLLSGHEAETAESVWAAYAGGTHFSRRLARGYAGAEIMRRLIGVAQLPLRADLAQKQALLAVSRELVRDCA